MQTFIIHIVNATKLQTKHLKFTHQTWLSKGINMDAFISRFIDIHYRQSHDQTDEVNETQTHTHECECELKE
jgi:hypothetical protein